MNIFVLCFFLRGWIGCWGGGGGGGGVGVVALTLLLRKVDIFLIIIKQIIYILSTKRIV